MLSVTGYDIPFVDWEIEKSHIEEWLLDKDKRETTQQQQD